MKRLSVFFAVFLSFVAISYSQISSVVAAPSDLDETVNCVMVYVKEDARYPNLTVACDGERILSHTVKTVDLLPDPTQFTSELYQAFQVMVNASGRKECKPYDLDGVWFASCLTQP